MTCNITDELQPKAERSKNIEETAAVLKLLGDKTRLTMLKILQQKDLCVCEFTEIFNISQPAISRHLRKLKDGGLVQEQRKGQWIYYSLRLDHKYSCIVQSILSQLPEQTTSLNLLNHTNCN